MAIRGRKPTATVVRLFEGNRGKRPIPEGEPIPVGGIEKPKKKMKKGVEALWDEFISRAYWLTWADGPKAFVWCNLQYQFEKKPEEMGSGLIAQLRAIGSELGLDPAARARLGAKGTNAPQGPKDKSAEYFD